MHCLRSVRLLQIPWKRNERVGTTDTQGKRSGSNCWRMLAGKRPVYRWSVSSKKSCFSLAKAISERPFHQKMMHVWSGAILWAMQQLQFLLRGRAFRVSIRYNWKIVVIITNSSYKSFWNCHGWVGPNDCLPYFIGSLCIGCVSIGTIMYQCHTNELSFSSCRRFSPFRIRKLISSWEYKLKDLIDKFPIT